MTAEGKNYQPHDLDAERAVLGAVLRRPVCLAEVAEAIGVDDFHGPEHRLLFETMKTMYRADQAIDVLRLGDHLRGTRTLGQLVAFARSCPDYVEAIAAEGRQPEFIDGTDYLLWLDRFVPTAENVMHYVDIVRDKANLRRLRELAADAYTAAGQPDADPETVVEALRCELTACVTGHGWDPPTPLHRVDVPPFPIKVLPPWLSNYARAVAKFSQTPPDLAGLLGVAGLSAAARGGFDIEAPVGHREPLCLYLAVVLPPGERKSSVFQAMAGPIVGFEAAETERLAPQIAEEQAHRDILVKRVEGLKARAAKIDDPTERAALIDEAQDLASELAELPPIPSARLLADDSTPEALVGLLAAHGGNIAVLSAEGGLFDNIAGLYNDGRSNLDGILKAHDAEPIRVDRRGRPSEHISRATLTVGLTVQPTVIEGIMANSRFRGRGLTARFLFAVPESRVGCRAITVDQPPEAFRVAYAAGVLAMLRSRPEDGPVVLRCSPGALASFDDFRRELEPRLHPDSGDLAIIADFAGKLPGTLVRIAGLFHLAEHGGQAETVQVTESTMLRALALGAYFIAHAGAVFGMMGADAGVAGARRVLAWIRRKDVTGFSVRQAHNALQRHFPRAEDLHAPLRLLTQHSYVRQDPSPKGRNGRPPSPRYTVSPLWRRGGFVGSVSMYAGVEDENEAIPGESENEGGPLHTDIRNIQNPPPAIITQEQGAQPSDTEVQPGNAGARVWEEGPSGASPGGDSAPADSPPAQPSGSRVRL